MRILSLFVGLITACIVLAGCSAPEGENKIKVLIVTGQNNHHWKVSSAALEKILENSGMFTVDIAVSPEKGADMSAFRPTFSDYDAVILDYNGDDWPENTQDDFLSYVDNGGGLIVYHAANNAFPGWEEYNRVTALGGWEGRSELSGPYVYLVEGEVVRDHSPGRGGSHGSAHRFTVEAVEADHPVTRGLPEKWLHDTDELYDMMRGPGNVKDILYKSYSFADKGGTDRDEPLVFTVDYGPARIFHIMLGHAGSSLDDNPAMQCAGFQTLLLRGAEWAATGEVTQPVPPDFPGPDTVSLRPDYTMLPNERLK